jgi:hypothetical protein
MNDYDRLPSCQRILMGGAVAVSQAKGSIEGCRFSRAEFTLTVRPRMGRVCRLE